MKHALLLAAIILMPASASGEETMDHSHMSQAMPGHGAPVNIEAGQSAFAAIAEIVALLENDPMTDWSRVDIQALRDHLADMDRVTLQTRVAVEPVTGGAIFTVSGDGETAAAAQRMMLAHAPFLAAATGFTVEAKPTDDGAVWRVTSKNASDEAQIRGLGFYGLLAIGSHHQPHHLALARGEPMH